MRAQKIIEGAALGPEVLNVLAQAFNEAWAAVEAKFAPHEHEVAREVLAIYMTTIMRDDSSDVAMLREAGIRSIQQAYPRRFEGDGSGHTGEAG